MLSYLLNQDTRDAVKHAAQNASEALRLSEQAASLAINPPSGSTAGAALEKVIKLEAAYASTFDSVNNLTLVVEHLASKLDKVNGRVYALENQIPQACSECGRC